MTLLRALIRLLAILAGAVVGLALFVMALLAFAAFLLVRLVTGRKPDLQFRVNRNPWAGRQPPAGDVVDVQAREVSDAPEAGATRALPLQAPDQR